MNPNVSDNPVLKLIVALAVCFAAAAIGSVASVQAFEFYQQLEQPSWAPPGSVFGPVWTLLYSMMAISFWLILKSKERKQRTQAILFFIIQLVLNALWSWLFFAWHQGGLALAELSVLWVFILLTVVNFWRINILAGALMIPYLLWVTFAGALNLAVWQLNPSAL